MRSARGRRAILSAVLCRGPLAVAPLLALVASLVVTLGACGGAAPGHGAGAAAARGGAGGSAGGAGGASASAGGASGDDAAASSVRAVQLLFELRGQQFPLPLVHGSVGGVETWMLVDTGANSHVIAGWLARKAKLDARDVGDQGTDHAGRTILTSRVDKHGMQIEGWGRIPDGPTLVTEIPEAVARLGIGAFISPQHLAGKGQVVVLDLAHHEMRAVPAEGARDGLSGRGAVLLADDGRAVEPCEDNDSPIKGLAFVVGADIEGSKVHLLLDTGAHHSDLLASSSAARRFMARSVANKEQVYAASGRISTRTLRRARLRVGEFATVADVDLIPGRSDSSCPRDGVLAMDVLKTCVLVIDQAKVYGRCGG